MKEKPFFFQLCDYKNEVDLIDKVLSIYSIIKKSNDLRPFERNILNFYIRKGISNDTKNIIKDQLGITSNNLTQANYYLRKKGYIVKDSKNHNKNKLCKDLESIRTSIIGNKKRLFLVGFNQK